VFGKARRTGDVIARAIVSVPRLHNAEIKLRNIIFNVEQNPKSYTPSEVIRNMRQALGLKEGERP
jgi:hypothetical protein